MEECKLKKNKNRGEISWKNPRIKGPSTKTRLIFLFFFAIKQFELKMAPVGGSNSHRPDFEKLIIGPLMVLGYVRYSRCCLIV